MKLRLTRRKRENGWTCTRVQQYWDAYTEDVLSVQDKFEYEAHLAKCEKCQDFLHFLKYVKPAIAGALRETAHVGVTQTPIQVPQKLIDAAERLPVEGKLRLAEFARQAEEDDRLREEEDRVREEKRRRREVERERMGKRKPN